MRANKDRPRHKKKGTPQYPLFAVHPIIRDLVVERVSAEYAAKAALKASLDLPTSDSLHPPAVTPAQALLNLTSDSANPVGTSADPVYSAQSQADTSSGSSDSLPHQPTA